MSQADFEHQYRIFAFQPSVLATLGDLRETYGAYLPRVPLDLDSDQVLCIGGHIDRADSADLRAAEHPTTATTTPLTDGRHAARLCWSLAILAALDSGDLDGIELTDGELALLAVKPPEDEF